MATVRLCGPLNSTMFTTCCDVAILDHQGKCPQCSEDVEPFNPESQYRTHRARWEKAYGRQRAANSRDVG